MSSWGSGLSADTVHHGSCEGQQLGETFSLQPRTLQSGEYRRLGWPMNEGRVGLSILLSKGSGASNP